MILIFQRPGISFQILPIPDYAFFKEGGLPRSGRPRILVKDKASDRSSFTSDAVAWRAVSPESWRFPASRNSFDYL